MPVTTLDPKTALIVIDLQKGILSFPSAHPKEGVIQQAGALIEAFRRHGRPVVLVNVVGMAPGRNEQAPRAGGFPDGFADFIPELNQQPSDMTVSKRTWGAFASTDLAARLKALEVTQVVLAGISTSVGVESTARQAYELGLNVTLAIDAMTDGNADAHINSVTRIFPRLGETGAAAEIIALLDR
ncbi:MAG: Isochorismatase hydrolase [Caulobacter sp.]|nr:Isochorismatase hydrolase [Caulobacter sp.]